MAFVRYYAALVNHAAKTGDASRMRAAAPTCKECEDVADLLEDTLRSGGSVDPASIWRLVDVQSVSGADVVLASVREPPITRVPSAGASPIVTEGGRIHFEFWLRFDTSGWQINKLVRT